MKCAWNACLNILPMWIRSNIDNPDVLQEIRLRCGMPAKIISQDGIRTLDGNVTRQDIQFIINTVSHYSPWSVQTVSSGYLTCEGGHRIGICGNAGNHEHGIIDPTSLCIRIARDFPGISESASKIEGSFLIIGPPGCGKTTFLRDLIREKSHRVKSSISVIDEKMEIFPKANGKFCFSIGPNTDVMSGCSKKFGIESVLRNMGPQIIAVDEITAQEDCESLIQAGWCGVDLLATVHASSLKDLQSRKVYAPLVQTSLFHNIIILQSDKSWKLERV